MASEPELEPSPESGQSLARRRRHDLGWAASSPRIVARLAGLCALLMLMLSGYKLALGAGRGDGQVGAAAPGPAPPGPRGLPLIGSALSLDFNSMIGSFAGLAKKSGNVFQVKSVGESVVVLPGYETISHAELFEERPVMPMFEHMLEGHGVLFSRGERWRQMRRFALRTLHDFGMGRSIIEEEILEEAAFLSAEFEAMRGAPWDPKAMISCAVSNINNVFTFLRHLPGPHTRLFENVRRLKAFLSSFIEVHRNAPEQDEPQDFIAAFLARQRKPRPRGPPTTSTTLYWALLLLLMKNPDVQRKHRSSANDTKQPHAPCSPHLNSAGRHGACYPTRGHRGRRVFLGEQLAKAELFLVALLQKFSFVAPRGPDSLSLASQNGITVAPLPFEVSTVPL
ncbi:unnamed protein product [Lampetra fluviatilis]